MRPFALLASTLLFGGLTLRAQSPGPKLPILADPELRIEQLATIPEIEAPATVAVAPDGSFYVGCDPRDTRLNTRNPECWIVRFSGVGADRKRTVFADKLYSPAGSYWFRGSLYVIHDPFLTRFKDTNGDGVADEREDLVTGLGLPPYEGLNDHVVSGFTLGMDGYFYISVGDRGVLKAVGKDGSTATLQGGGIMRVRPDGTELEVFSTGTRNHLMVDLDAEDNAFTRDNTDDGNGWWTRLTHHIEGGYYGYPYDYQTPSEEWLPAMADFGGGSPTGGLVYMSDGLPEKYRNQPLFSEWGKSTVFLTQVEREGATFRLKQDLPIAKSDGKQVDFRPMELAVAPDGALLVADWGWGGWKAAKVLGSVWRISWPEAKPTPRIADDAPAVELIDALAHVDRNQRLRAQWALVDRAKESAPLLARVLADAARPTVQRWHALWAIDQIGEIEGIRLVRDRLGDGEPSVRAQAARALGTRRIGVASADLIPLLKDRAPSVRLHAATALGRIHEKQGWQAKSAATALVSLLDDEDRWIRYAARIALKRINDWGTVENALTAGSARVREQAWLALSRIFDPDAVEVLIRRVGEPDSERRKRAAELLARLAYESPAWDGHWWGTQPVKNPPPPATIPWAGTAAATNALATLLGDKDTGVRYATAKGLARVKGVQLTPALRNRLAEEKDPEVRRQLVETIGIHRDAESAPALVALAADEGASEALRRAAIGAIGKLGGDAAKTTIRQLADREFSVPTTLEIIAAVGALRIHEAAPGLAARSTHPDVSVRVAAVKSLGQVGRQANVYKPLVNALTDVDRKVQTEAVDAIGSLRLEEAVPQLIAMADVVKDENLRRRTLTALSDMGDDRAVPVLVKHLLDPQQRVRREVATALAKFGSDVAPLIEGRVASMPPEVAAQVRAIFNTGTISKWRVIGPFENVWEAQHDVERDLVAGGASSPDLQKKYIAANGKPVGWLEVQGNSEGKIDLAKLFGTTGLAAAYAWVEFDSPAAATAKLLAGSDDQIAVWLNGRKVHDRADSGIFQPESDVVPLDLAAGKNQLVLKVGNGAGAWQFAARLPNLIGGKYVISKEPSPEEKQRAFALATKSDGSWQNPGDRARGEQLFHDPAAGMGAICATCHVAGGRGGAIGPDLSAVGVNYKRGDLITSILEPSKTIALGFEQVVVETGGETIVGALRSETADLLNVQSADGKLHAVRKTEAKKLQHLPVSLMPAGLTLGLKADEFTDLIAYLESLRGK
jgi:putative membrane-bound dehydrogenase-like protein